MTTADEIGWVATSDTLERLVAALDAHHARRRRHRVRPREDLLPAAVPDPDRDARRRGRASTASRRSTSRRCMPSCFARTSRGCCTARARTSRSIWQRAQRMPPRLIDTQIAAALIGWPPQIGLESLLERTLDVELGESYARTDWSRRPLPPAALALRARRRAPPARRVGRAQAQLAELGRARRGCDEDCARVLAERPVADTLTVWARLKGVHGLPFAAQCAALELVRWRERAAQRSDRPRRWLLDRRDAARARGRDAARRRRLSAPSCRRSSPRATARTVLAAVARARRNPTSRRSCARMRRSRRPTRTWSKRCRRTCGSAPRSSASSPRFSRRGATSSPLAAGRPPAHLHATAGARAGARRAELEPECAAMRPPYLTAHGLLETARTTVVDLAGRLDRLEQAALLRSGRSAARSGARRPAGDCGSSFRCRRRAAAARRRPCGTPRAPRAARNRCSAPGPSSSRCAGP